MIEYNIRVNLQGDREQYANIIFTSGDKQGYRLNFAFYSYGARIDVSNCAMTVKIKRADSQVILDNGTTEKEGAYYIVADNGYSVAGAVSFEVALVDMEGSLVTAHVVHAYVREGFGEQNIAPEDVNPILAKAAVAVESATTAAEKANAAAESVEEAVTAAEQATEDAMTATELAEKTNSDAEELIKQITLSEEGRATSEEKRAAEETTRNESEKSRQAAESQRHDNEEFRCKEENARKEMEDARMEAELLRAATEAERQAAETARREAELIRLDQEDKRSASEDSRQLNEEERLEAEKERFGAEVRREEAEALRQEAERERIAAEAERQEAYEQMNETFANALKGSLTGSAVFLDDVSPMTHTPTVKVSGVEDLASVTLVQSGKNLNRPFEHSSSVNNGNLSLIFSNNLLTLNGSSMNVVSLNNVGGGCILPPGTYTFSNQYVSGECINTVSSNDKAFYFNVKKKAGSTLASFACYGKSVMMSTKSVTFTLTETTEIIFYFVGGGEYENYQSRIMINVGEIPEQYEDYAETRYPVNADGTVDNVALYHPYTSLLPDTSGAVVSCEYNKDTNKVIEKLTNAIISLGGNV